MFVPIALIKVYNGTAGNFTFKTTFWDAALVTSSIVDATVTGWDRTKATGFNSHQITVAGLPADVTAPIPSSGPAALSASKPTAGPASLTAGKPTAGAASLSAAAVDIIQIVELGIP